MFKPIRNAAAASERLVELRQREDALLSEADALCTKGDELAEDGKALDPADAGRFDAIMGRPGEGGELTEVRDEIRFCVETVTTAKAEALAKLGSTPAAAPSSSVPTPTAVVDRSSGRSLPVASAGERLFSAGEQRTEPRFGRAVLDMLRGESTLPRNEAVFSGGDSGGNFVIDPAETGILLDLVRPAMIWGRAGARFFDMTSPEMTVATIVRDPKAHWVAPLQRVPATSAAFGQMNLRSRKEACIIPVDENWLDDVANGAEVLQQAATASMAQAMDLAITRGVGAANEPLGVLNTPGINAVEGVGYPADHSHLTRAVGRIMRADFPGSAAELTHVVHPRDAEVLDGMRDLEGRPLEPTPWTRDLATYTTSQLQTTLGSGGDESEALVGHAPSVLIGMRKQITARFVDAGDVTSEDGTTYSAPSQLLRYMVLTARMDCVVLRPAWFTAITGLLSVDPAA